MKNHIYTDIMNALRAGKCAVLQQRLPQDEGDTASIIKNLMDPEDAHAISAIQIGAPVLNTENGAATVLEPFFPEQRLIVLGGGHVALPVVDFASKTGFSVVVADDRPSFANPMRFPSADGVICESFEKVFDRLNVTSSDYVVIITRGHRYDMLCLEKVLQGPEPFYVGMIGSRSRVAAVKNALIEMGYDAARVERTHTPIGLKIGALTPAEIAISILAEMISCKRLGGGSGATNRSDMDMNVLRVLAEETGEPKAVVTVLSARGSVPRGPGAKMLVYPDRRIIGSIGGGCCESAVIDIACRMIGTGRYRLHTVNLTADITEEEGMACGGMLQVLIEDFQPEFSAAQEITNKG